jgi:hypothetical protein
MRHSLELDETLDYVRLNIHTLWSALERLKKRLTRQGHEGKFHEYSHLSLNRLVSLRHAV